MVAVTEESPSQGRLLADRLDYLFRTVHPKDRRPYTPAEVAEAINEAAGERVISWIIPGTLEALIPGRMQGHGGTEEVSR